jgi:hypothetical protein
VILLRDWDRRTSLARGVVQTIPKGFVRVGLSLDKTLFCRKTKDQNFVDRTLVDVQESISKSLHHANNTKAVNLVRVLGFVKVGPERVNLLERGPIGNL